MKHPEDEQLIIRYVLRLAKALHESGVPSHRLELELEKFCQKIGIEVDFFVTIGSIFASIQLNNSFSSHMVKIKNGDLNLERIDQLQQLMLETQKGNYSIEESFRELNLILKRENRYAAWVQVLFFGISTGSAACVFGGKLPAILCSFIIGLGIGGFFQLLRFVPSLRNVSVFFAAFFAVVCASLFQVYVSDFQKEIATICGLIVLIPGFSFTVSITEIVNNHFISGLSRLSAAFITFALIAIGIVVGTKLMDLMHLHSQPFELADTLFWIKWIALVFVPLGFMVLFKANPKDFFWVALACWIAYFSFDLFSSFLPGVYAVFISSFILGLAATLFSIFMKRNSSLMLVPGMILLVPGSLGFSSITQLIDSNVTEGIQTAITMLGTALALVFGLLFSNLIVPVKRINM